MPQRDFGVWATRPHRVQLAWRPAGSGDEPTATPMTRDSRGWWHPSEPLTADDVEYGYLIDEDPTPRPDPRSRRQPRGVHELSATVAEFDWTDHDWTGRILAGGVIYELHIGTFTPEGTFDAAIERLPHLVELGIDFVELLPVNAFNGVHNWGYDGVLWFAVHEPYGGPDGYRRFVDACHNVGLGVIQDVVYNHLGPSGNYLPMFADYLHDGRANTWGSNLNLDGPDSDEVRRYILDNITMWLRDYHVDGLRLDAVHALVDHRAVHLLEDIAVHTENLSAHVGRPLSLIAESDLNDPRLITSRQAGGYGLTAQWSDDYHHVLHVALTGETVGYYGDFGTMEAIAKVLTTGFFHDGSWSSFRGRTHGRPLDTRTTPTWALVGYAQDHDQIGNRATGDRLTASLGPEDLAVAAVLVLTAPFTPMLFMGEEWGASTPWQFFTSHPEPELGEATEKGRLVEFERMGWDPAVVPNPQAPSTFTDSKLRWEEIDRDPHARLFDLHRQLIALRRSRPELTDPRFDRVDVRYDEDARWLVINRSGLQIAVNLGDDRADITLEPHGELLLSTAEISGDRAPDADLDPDDRVVRVDPHSAIIVAPPPHADR